MENTPLFRLTKAVKTVLLDLPDIYREFEDSIRDIIASSDLQVLLSGNVPSITLFHSVRTSLAKIAESVPQDRPDIYYQLHGPFVNVLIDLLEEQCLLATTAYQDKQKVATHTVKKDPNLMNTRIKPTKSIAEQNVVKPDLSLVHTQLLTYLQKNPAPYKRIKHIACDSNDCRFCTSLFRNVHLTKCEGHKPCVQAGWFPHVGKALWSSLRRKHEVTKTFVGMVREIKSHELPPLEVATHTSPQHSVRSTGSPATIRQEDGPISWADEVAEASSQSVSMDASSITDGSVVQTYAESLLGKRSLAPDIHRSPKRVSSGM